MAGALKGSKIQGDGVRAADAAGEEKGLIKAPLPEAPGMQRNAEDEFEIGKGEIRLLIFRQESAQRFGQAGGPMIFEARDCLYHQTLVRSDGSGPGEVTFLSETPGAKVVLPGRIPEADTTAGATRMGKELYPGKAKRTGVIVG